MASGDERSNVDLPNPTLSRNMKSKTCSSITYPPSDETPDWSNLQILHRNTLPPRSSFRIWPNQNTAESSMRTKLKLLKDGEPIYPARSLLNGEIMTKMQKIQQAEHTPYTISLAGTWSFKIESYPVPLSQVDVNTWGEQGEEGEEGEWDKIQVPGMWQCQFHTKDSPSGDGKKGGKKGERYGKPQYTNVNYPWPVDVHGDVARVPSEENETGCYFGEFEVPGKWLEGRNGNDRANGGVGKMEGEQVRLRFEGVDSAFHVWVNGCLVGYSQGARNPSEFDVLKYLNGSGETNRIAVRVYQRCDGSYLEDQDQWWLSGIFRDVTLNYFPAVHIKDFKIETFFVWQTNSAILFLCIDLNVPSPVTIKLEYEDLDGPHPAHFVKSMTQDSPLTTVYFEMVIENPRLWSAEDPKLYTLYISAGQDVKRAPVVAWYIGVRDVKIRDGLLKVNNSPILFRGVNRHEHSPNAGRTVHFSYLWKDLMLMKKLGINAVRTSHYPNDPKLYELADALGLYVLDEADLECHGMGELGGPYQEKTSDNPAWEAAYLDRIQQLVHRDKNHPSVIMWSLGNESFYGRNHRAMYRWVKDYDKTRPIHYEPNWGGDVSDVESHMYWSVSDCVSWLQHADRKKEKEQGTGKPLILCEFVHAMGNGPGGVKEYIDAMYKYPNFQGGFVWEWANHGLITTETIMKPDGTSEDIKYYRYGGDFGDVPNDGHFVLDGLCFSDHTPTPGLLTYGHAIQPVEILNDIEWGDQVNLHVINRYDHISLDNLRCLIKFVGEDDEQRNGEWAEVECEIPHVGPGEKGTIYTGVLRENLGNKDLLEGKTGEVLMEVRFVIKNRTEWGNVGEEVAWAQMKMQPPRSLDALIKELSQSDMKPLLTQEGNIVTIHTEQCEWELNAELGHLTSWKNRRDTGDKDEENFSSNLLDPQHPPLLSFYRALTDNDRPQDGQDWINSRLHEVKHHLVSFHAEVCNESEVKEEADARDEKRSLVMQEAEPHPITLQSVEYFVDEPPAGTPGDDGAGSNRFGRTIRIPSHAVGYFADTLSAQPSSIPTTSSLTPKKATVVKVVVKSRFAPPVLEWSIDVTTAYIFRASSVEISVKGHPRGLKLPPTLARIGLSFHIASTDVMTTYWGRGPGEAYRDASGGARMGRFTLRPGDALGPANNLRRSGIRGSQCKRHIAFGSTDYEYPQENGNRTDVRWVDFRAQGKANILLKASFGDREGCSFSAGRYSTEDLDKATHAYELKDKKQDGVVVRLDWEHHGIGSGSCGPRPTEKYRLTTGDFMGKVLLEFPRDTER